MTKLREGERWVSCSREVEAGTAANRHVLTRNGMDTACGATGVGGSVWRGNLTKPPCLTCADRRRDPATDPRRVQRTRREGGGIPKGAVYVGRPTRWANPFRVERVSNWPRWAGVRPYQVVTDNGTVWDYPPGEAPPERPVIFGQAPDFIDGPTYLKRKANDLAVHLFITHTGPMGNYEYDDDTLADLRAALGGRDLACWCPPSDACHADHLLALAATNPKD